MMYCSAAATIGSSDVVVWEVRPKWRAAVIEDLSSQNMKIAAAAAIVGSASAWSTLTMKANPRKCTSESFLVAALFSRV